MTASPAFSVGGTKTTGYVPTVQSDGSITWAAVAAAAGVTTFNTRTGAVTLSKADVTGTGLAASDVSALGATAAAGGDLAGNYPNPTLGPGFFWRYASGLYYGTLTSSPNTNFTTTNQRINFVPFYVPRAMTIDRIGIQVKTLANPSVVRLGVYRDTAGKPNALVIDAGTIDSTTNGYKEITISQALTPDLYYLAAAAQGGTPVVTGAEPLSLFPASTTDGRVGSFFQNSVAGAFPPNATPAGTFAAADVSYPLVRIF